MSCNLLTDKSAEILKYVNEHFESDSQRAALLKCNENSSKKVVEWCESSSSILIKSDELRIGTRDIGYTKDLKGIPQIDKHTGNSYFPGNSILPRETSQKSSYLIFSNFDKASSNIKMQIMTLCETGKLLSYELPVGWKIIVLFEQPFEGLGKLASICGFSAEIED